MLRAYIFTIWSRFVVVIVFKYFIRFNSLLLGHRKFFAFCSISFIENAKFTNIHCGTKGQLKSECIYEIINSPKYCLKDLIDFCPGR